MQVMVYGLVTTRTRRRLLDVEIRGGLNGEIVRHVAYDPKWTILELKRNMQHRTLGYDVEDTRLRWFNLVIGTKTLELYDEIGNRFVDCQPEPGVQMVFTRPIQETDQAKCGCLLALSIPYSDLEHAAHTANPGSKFYITGMDGREHHYGCLCFLCMELVISCHGARGTLQTQHDWQRSVKRCWYCLKCSARFGIGSNRTQR